jgi:malonyl-CoA O-methyltransferase
MADIERELVKRSFDCHAREYDALAQVQQKVTDRFAELLQSSLSAPASLLDIGAGTGRLLLKVSQLLPDTDLVGIDLAFGMTKVARDRLKQSSRAAFICSDAENLPFGEGSFDIVVSTSTYQWISPLEKAFAEVYRVLKPDSSFSFALFGEKTLFELRDSYRRAVAESGGPVADRTHRFATAEEVIAALSASGFSGCSVHEEMEREIHPDVPALLRSIKGIGAGNAARTRDGGLSGRSAMLRMMEIYRENYGKPGGVQATYHVLYGEGKKI